MNDEMKKEKHTWTEEVQITGHELVERVKKLVEQGNVRRLIIRKPDDEVLLEVPLTTGVAVGGVVTLMVPVLAALGALAALLAEVKIEIVRVAETGEAEDSNIIQGEAETPED